MTSNAASSQEPSVPAKADQGFNQSIQGMRGIAILLVLLNHAGLPGFDGGFVGVDIFFVISGYLIGGLLLREVMTKGTIDLWSFYARRCRRLLPACVLVLVVILACVLWLYAPFEHRELMSSVRASSVYALNLWLAGRATDYFGGHTEAIPVLHLWSLAVEEQFYIIWPLLILGAAALFPRDRRRGIFRLTVVAGVLSLVACVVATDIKFQWAFYLAPTRVWEFCAGIVVAIRPPISLRSRTRAVTLLGWASLLTLAATTALFSSQIRFPGFWALIPVCASVGLLVVADSRGGSGPERLLRWRPLRWLGDCSYSVYLWHWPLLIFASVAYPRSSPPVTAAALLATLVLGWLSYRWVEQPFKHGLFPQWTSRRLVMSAVTVCVALAVVAHIFGRLELDSQQARFRDAAEWPAATQSDCLVLFDAVDQPKCEFGAAAPKATVVLFGDSHAMQWFTPLRNLAGQHGWRLVVLTKANCASADLIVQYYVTRQDYVQCSEWRENMFKRIAALKPDVVVATSSSGHKIPIDRWQAGVGSTIRRLKATGAQVAYVRDTPFANFDVPTCLSRAQWRGLAPDQLCTYPLAFEQTRYGRMATAEALAVEAQGGRYLDFPKDICNVADCPTERDGMILFKDRNHITEAFAQKLAPKLEAPLIELLRAAGRL